MPAERKAEMAWSMTTGGMTCFLSLCIRASTQSRCSRIRQLGATLHAVNRSGRAATVAADIGDQELGISLPVWKRRGIEGWGGAWGCCLVHRGSHSIAARQGDEAQRVVVFVAGRRR